VEPTPALTQATAPAASQILQMGPAAAKTLHAVEAANVPPGHLSKFQQAHTDVINAVKLLPDQKRALSVSGDGSLKLWAVATGECLWTKEDSVASFAGVDISPDGKLAATASRGGRLTVWDIETGVASYTTNNDDLLTPPVTRIGDATALKFTPDGTSLLYAVPPMMSGPRCWKFAAGGAKVQYTGWSAYPNSFVFLPGGNGETFITSGGASTRGPDGINVITAKELRIGQLSNPAAGTGFPEVKSVPARLVVTPDGKYIAAAEVTEVAVYDVASQAEVMRSKVGVTTFTLRFLDGGRLLLLGVTDGTLRILDVAKGNEVWRSTAETFCTNRVAVSADETFAVTGGGFGSNAGPGSKLEKDGDFALHLWRLPAASTFPSSGPIVVPSRISLSNLEATDPELAKLKAQFEAEWKEKVEGSTAAAREDLDNKYVTALRSRLQVARPSERDPFLTEISRVANKGAVPAVVDPTAPAGLQQLMQIYIQQLALLEQKPKDAAAALLKDQAARASGIGETRTQAGDTTGAGRAKLLWEEWEKAHAPKPAA
jgi:hypothetical protein